jgi:DNA-binding HxlR family transcriptional regulator
MVERAIGDDDLLAAVCAASPDSRVPTIRRRIQACLGVEMSDETLEQRLERLHEAGLVRRFQPEASAAPEFHLTELGVQRLAALEYEPPSE